MESSLLLEMTVWPLGLKSTQLILSEFSQNTLATRKLRSTLSVSFMAAAGEGSAVWQRAGCWGANPGWRESWAESWLARSRPAVGPPPLLPPPWTTVFCLNCGAAPTVSPHSHLRRNWRSSTSSCPPSWGDGQKSRAGSLSRRTPGNGWWERFSLNIKLRVGRDFFP